MNKYILIATASDGTFFKTENGVRNYYEIYKLTDKHQDLVSLPSEKDNQTNIVVEAINQNEALKKFINLHGNIFRFSYKNAYETVLPLNM